MAVVGVLEGAIKTMISLSLSVPVMQRGGVQSLSLHLPIYSNKTTIGRESPAHRGCWFTEGVMTPETQDSGRIGLGC